MIISGKELSAELKAEMAAQVATFPEKYGRVPHLVVILVGEDPGSVSYVTGKAKASEVVGIRNTTIRKPDTISEAELLGMIAELNADYHLCQPFHLLFQLSFQFNGFYP